MKAKSLKFVFASLALALGVGLMPKGEDVYQQLNSPFQSALNSTGVSVDAFNLFKDDVGASLNNIQNGINGMQKSSKMSKNLNIAMNRQTYAAFVSVAMAANYAVDVFDGLKEKVVFTDALPAFSAASSDDTYAIVGDFGYGFQANKPNGNDIVIKVDDLSLAEKDLVKIVGRQYVGMGVVASKAFVKIEK